MMVRLDASRSARARLFRERSLFQGAGDGKPRQEWSCVACSLALVRGALNRAPVVSLLARYLLSDHPLSVPCVVGPLVRFPGFGVLRVALPVAFVDRWLVSRV